MVFRVIFRSDDLIYCCLNTFCERYAFRVRFETSSKLAVKKRNGAAVEALISGATMHPSPLAAFKGTNSLSGIAIDYRVRDVADPRAAINARDLNVHLLSPNAFNRWNCQTRLPNGTTQKFTFDNLRRPLLAWRVGMVRSWHLARNG
jgi:hypothetical protein